jgi:hypothetical protein
MVERENDEQLPEEMPASATHRLPEEEWELEPAEFSREKALDYINRVQESPTEYIAHFELDLERVGLLSELEEKGILPTRANLIHHEYSDESVQGKPDIKQREDVLKNLYIGTVLGHLFDELYYRK